MRCDQRGPGGFGRSGWGGAFGFADLVEGFGAGDRANHMLHLEYTIRSRCKALVEPLHQVLDGPK